MSALALCASRVLTPEGFRDDACVVIADGRITAVVAADDGPDGARSLEGDLVPGFIDIQVNGGGGTLFNDSPTVEGVRKIAETHRRFGTTGLLPTLISDDLDVIAKAIAAVDAAIEEGVPGLLGIHIEGPFINRARKGIHAEAKIRTLDEDAIDLLASLRHGKTLVTLAPELAPPGAIRALVERGVIVAAGHTDASYEEMQSALAEGLNGFTHLFNAMSPLQSRAPGVVGAALESRATWCGVIVDGHHVHPAALRVALAAKGADHLLLVTDAMPPVGTDAAEFQLGGRRITVDGGRLTGEDGTLAGSILDMAQAVANAQRLLGIERITAVRMASANPAAALGIARERGEIRPGRSADLALLDRDGQVLETWIAGR